MLKRFVLLFAIVFSFNAYAEFKPSEIYKNIGTVDVDVLNDYFRKGGSANEKDTTYGISLLNRAVSFNNNPEIAKVIISHGADVNDKDRSGKTVLMSAVSFSNNPEIIKILLDNRANVDAVDINGINALMYAVAGNGSNLTSYVKRNIKDFYTGQIIPSNRSLEESPENSIEIVKMVMAKTRNLEAKDRAGKKALSHAAASNNLPEIIYLLADINPNFEDKNGSTPLFEAIAGNQDFAIVNALFDIGADVNFKNKDGMAALSVASISTSYPAMIDLLLEKGAIINSKDKFDKLPVFYATGNQSLNNSSVIKKLSK